MCIRFRPICQSFRETNIYTCMCLPAPSEWPRCDFVPPHSLPFCQWWQSSQSCCSQQAGQFLCSFLLESRKQKKTNGQNKLGPPEDRMQLHKSSLKYSVPSWYLILLFQLCFCGTAWRWGLRQKSCFPPDERKHWKWTLNYSKVVVDAKLKTTLTKSI